MSGKKSKSAETAKKQEKTLSAADIKALKERLLRMKETIDELEVEKEAAADEIVEITEKNHNLLVKNAELVTINEKLKKTRKKTDLRIIEVPELTEAIVEITDKIATEKIQMNHGFFLELGIVANLQDNVDMVYRIRLKPAICSANKEIRKKIIENIEKLIDKNEKGTIKAVDNKTGELILMQKSEDVNNETP